MIRTLLILIVSLFSASMARAEIGSMYGSEMTPSNIRGYDIYGENITWLEEEVNLECAEDMVFFDTNFGGMVCNEMLYISYNGGRLWEPVQSFTNPDLSQVIDLDGIELTSNSTIIMTGTVAYDAGQASQKAVVVVRSDDMGATFHQAVLDNGLAPDAEVESAVFNGNYGVFGSKDGTTYFVTSDEGKTWTKTTPPFESVGGLPAIEADGSVNLVRVRPTGESKARGVYRCKMNIKDGEWGCQNTLLLTSQLDDGSLNGRFLVRNDSYDLMAFGMENSVFGGIFKPDPKIAGVWIQSLGANASCYDIQAIDSKRLLALCYLTESPANITTALFTSSNGGGTWRKDVVSEDVVQAKLFLHRLVEDGTYEVVVYDGRQLRIGKFKE